MSAVLDALVAVNSSMVDIAGQTYAAFHHDRKIGLIEARLNIKSALKSAQKIVDALEAAERSLDDVLPASVVDMNKAPASFQPVGNVGGAVVGRLVPRISTVKSAGAMGTTSPGPEAA